MTPAAVLHLVDTLEAGGAERVAVELVNRLPRDRFEPHLGTTRREGPLAAMVSPAVQRLALARRGRFDLLAAARLGEYLRRHRVAIVHAHASALFLATLVTRRSPGVRLIWHDHFGRHDTERRPRRLYRWAARRADGVVAVTAALADWSRQELQVPADRVWQVPNFAPDGAITTPATDLPGAPGRRIVCVANLRPQKDHPTLLRAMARLATSDPGAHLLLVGTEVEPRYAATVRAAIASPALAGRVSLLGRRDDVPAVLRACDVAVLASSSEGLPLALLEYGAAGLPVVATRVGECAAVLGDGDAGLLVEAGDDAALAAALGRLLRSPDDRRTFGERLGERVRARYSPAAVVERVAAIYDLQLRDGRRR